MGGELKSAVYGMLTQRHQSGLPSAPLWQQGNLEYFPVEAMESSKAHKTIREHDSRLALPANFLNLCVRIRLGQTDLSIERRCGAIHRAGIQRRVLQDFSGVLVSFYIRPNKAVLASLSFHYLC